MKAEQRVQDRYTLIEALGRGGMAEVWLAHDERLKRDVAIKFMAANLTHEPEFLVRFFSEAQAVARISHPNVVAVLDFGDFEDRPYLVMECVPGGALSELTGEPMPPERAAEIVAGAAAGAGAAHRLGLVHRDVKPGNILLDDDGRSKLADFGIASSSRSEKLTATGTAIGSPHYISPEQASGGPVTAASDVYSLGAVLYELLTGRPPFEADNVTAIAIAHVEQEPQPPSALVGGLPPHLDAIVLACLAKDPAARPADGAALAEALESASVPATTSIPAVPGSEPDPDSLEPVQKRRLIPALLALSLLLALAGTLYVAGRPEDVAEAGTSGPPGKPAGTKRRAAPSTATPTATPAESEAVTTSAIPAATPSPTPEPEEQEQERTTATPEPEEDDEPLWTPDPTQEPEPSEEPAPSEEPEPTPAPAPSGEPTPAPGDGG